MRLDGVCVDVVAMGLVVARVLDTAKREALVPDGHFGFEAEGEASFDVLNGLFDGDVWGGREEEMEMVWHEDEGVELVAAFGAVGIEEVQEERRVRVGLEETAALGGDGGNEEGSDFLRGSLHRSKLERDVVGRKITSVWLGLNREEFDRRLEETRKARG